MANKIVISVGGKLINPGTINLEFLRNFRDFILRNQDGNQFYIITGGGRVAREYQQALRDLGETDNARLDLMGIAATRLNGELVRTLLGNTAAPQIFTDPEQMLQVDAKVYVSGGTAPGWSTDFVTVKVAQTVGADTVVNFLDFDHLYTADPSKHPEATPLEAISYDELKKIIGDVWVPGANAAFDPEAAKLAADAKIKIVMLNGLNTDNLEKYVKGEAFVGTKIGF